MQCRCRATLGRPCLLWARCVCLASLSSPAPSASRHQGCRSRQNTSCTLLGHVGTDLVLRRLTGEPDTREALMWHSTRLPNTARRIIDLVIKVPGRLEICRSAEIDLHSLDGKGAHKVVQDLKNKLAEEFFHHPGVQRLWDEVKDVSQRSQKMARCR